MHPTYYVRHPDDTYSVVAPQPAEVLVDAAITTLNQLGRMVGNSEHENNRIRAALTAAFSECAPLATPADAGAGDEHPHKADAAELSIAQVVERLRRDAAGGLACNVFELDRAADLLESLARLSTSGAPAPEGTVTLCQYSSFGPWIECDPSDEKAVKFAPVRQSPAPVTAEPAQSIDTPEFRELLDKYRHCASWETEGVIDELCAHIATPAPADRDAIRDQALEEAAKACQEHSQCTNGAYRTACFNCAVEIRDLKSMERAADAKGEQQ